MSVQAPATAPGSPTRVGLLRDVAGGALVGILEVVVAISLASLVFATELEAFRASGIGLVLTGTLLVGAVALLLGSLPATAACVQDTPAAVVAVIAAAALAALPGDAEPMTRFMTVVALVALITLTTGIVFLAVGAFGLGKLVRYLPYPVVGGFLAGTGWLLLTGGIAVMSGVPPSLANLDALLAAGTLERWLPGLAFAVLIVIVTRRSSHPLAFPALVAAAVAAFFLALAASGATASEWRAAGHLLGPFPHADLLLPIRPLDLQHVHWGVVASHAAGGASVALLSLVAVLLNVTGLELALGRRLDLNRELRAAGLGNLLAGSTGGMVGYQVLSFTMLNHRIGGGTWRTALVAVVVVGAALLQGTTLLEFVPIVVVGGVIAFLGLSFLIDWVFSAYSRLSRLEYAIVLAILLAIVGIGFLPGVGLGLVLAVVLFVVEYARVDPVKHALSGVDSRSRVRWSAADERVLSERGASLLVLRLQGFLFFGSVTAVVERIERRLEARPALEFLILDFRQVSGADASAAAGFASLVRSLSGSGCTLLLADLLPPLARQLGTTVLRANGGERAPRVVASLDDALEWCERRLLAGARGDPLEDLDDRLRVGPLGDVELQDLIAHLERVEVPAGTRIIVQGDASDSLYLVASGRVSAWFEPPDGPPVRLETMEGGTMIGESGLYTGVPRSASVVADAATVLYRITRDELEALTAREPSAAAAFHALVARTLADRAAHLQRVAAALQR